VKAFFDLSTLGSWNKKAHRRAWEDFLARASAHSPDLTLTSDPSTADIVIQTGSPGFFDSSVSSALRPITNSDIERLVWDWGDAPFGRFSGFYCSLRSELFDSRRHRTMSYPIVFNEFVDEFAQTDATLDFSFVGGITAGVRTRIFEAFGADGKQHNALVSIQPASWTTILDGTDLGIKREYAESLRKAKFILCPRGAGVGSVRLFETMRAGRVPVIISDGYVLPSDIDWDRCAVVVREAKVRAIPDIIGSRMHEWSDMATRARQAWEENFSDRTVLSYLARQVGAIRTSSPDADLRVKASYAVRVGSVLVEQRLRPVAGRVRQRAFRKGN
jgi:hypothetical protein